MIAHSYDSLFSIRKIIRKINDIQIPVKHGLATDQIGAFIVVFVASLVVFGVVVVPLLGLLGVRQTPLITAVCLLGPPVLAAQRIAKPMGYGKTIGGTMSSWARYTLDDRVHRRGQPIPTPPRPMDVPVQHYQRSWVMYADFVDDEPGEQDWSDPITEYRLDGEVIALQPWLDEEAREHLVEERTQRRKQDEDADVKANFKRGRAASVYMPGGDDVDGTE